jgi:hypothetical protein
MTRKRKPDIGLTSPDQNSNFFKTKPLAFLCLERWEEVIFALTAITSFTPSAGALVASCCCFTLLLHE